MRSNYFFPIAIISTVIVTMTSCGGESKPTIEKPKTETSSTESVPNSNIKGEDVYKKTCVACHQANGEGIPNTFPPLAKSDFLVNKEAVIHQVISGKTGEITVNGVKYNSSMPPQALSDEEIAGVLNYVYSNWGNNPTTFTTEEVKAVREKGH